MIALGDGMGGMWSPSDELAASLSAASKRAGEKLWRMPLEDSYFEQLKSSCADMKNTGGRLGGSITAALFLKEYVDTGKVCGSGGCGAKGL
jgi:leucyl aminopeptidase